MEREVVYTFGELRSQTKQDLEDTQPSPGLINLQVGCSREEHLKKPCRAGNTFVGCVNSGIMSHSIRGHQATREKNPGRGQRSGMRASLRKLDPYVQRK